MCDNSKTLPHFISIDVGTSSVRAALVRQSGDLVTKSIRPIQIWSGAGETQDHYEQSSDDIWSAVVLTIKEVMGASGVAPDSVCGVGFDATCSLVVLDHQTQPLSVSASGDPCRNIVMWMDHRAKVQTKHINSTHNPVLDGIGGSVSIEMQLPKILWLKQHLKEQCYDKAAHFFDLPDYLTWRATGSLSRSMCSVVCKFLYSHDDSGTSKWPIDFLTQIGLQELTENNCHRIGTTVQQPGEPCGNGLTPEVATSLGLNPGTPVATSIVDAYAGCLGTVSYESDASGPNVPLTERMTMISGTSTCHLTLYDHHMVMPGYWGPFYSALLPGFWCSAGGQSLAGKLIAGSRVNVQGVWGPYYSVILPEYWLSEGGQNTAGKLLEHIVTTHPAYKDATTLSSQGGIEIYEYLHKTLVRLKDQSQLPSIAHLTKHLHMWPDYHGNRTPLADETLKGMLSGLSLSCGVEDLALLYLATVQALAYGTRHILQKMGEYGREFKVIMMCGGLCNNRLYVTTHADVTGLPVVVPAQTDTVLLGTAMLACRAAGHVSTLQEAMDKMRCKGQTYQPCLEDKRYHEQKYQVFTKMVLDQYAYRHIMDDASWT